MLPQLCTGRITPPLQRDFYRRAYFCAATQPTNHQVRFCTDGGADRCSVPPFDGGPPARPGRQRDGKRQGADLRRLSCKSLELLRTSTPTACMPSSFSAQSRKRKAIHFVREKGVGLITRHQYGLQRPRSPAAAQALSCTLGHTALRADGAAARRAGRDTPLTVKMRIGWDADHLTGVEVAKRVEEANGADHRRTQPHAEQMYITPIGSGDRCH